MRARGTPRCTVAVSARRIYYYLRVYLLFLDFPGEGPIMAHLPDLANITTKQATNIKITSLTAWKEKKLKIRAKIGLNLCISRALLPITKIY